MGRSDLHLLFLEGDSGYGPTLSAAAQAAGLDGRLRLVRTPQEALDSDTGWGAPAILLIDLSNGSGLALLEHLKQFPELRKRVTIGLVPPRDGATTARAYELGVRSCLERPDTPEEQMEFFRSLRQYWELNEPNNL